MILSKINISSDLSEASLEDAIKSLTGSPEKLVVSTTLISIAGLLVRKYKIPFFIDTDLSSNTWYIQSKYFGLFSPGA